MIVSHEAAMWFVTSAALLICGIWGARELYVLFRILPRARRERSLAPATWRDQLFGSLIGLTIISLGLYGIYRYVSTH
jgi:hypothetical protein